MDLEDIKKLRDLHESYLKGTNRKAPVKYERILVTHVSKVTVDGIKKEWENFSADRVYVTTYALKHVFDSRQAQEYDAILEHLPIILNQPDTIYENLDGKRGELAFIKVFQITAHDGSSWQETFFCSLQVTNGELEVATAFRFSSDRKKENYLKKYKLLWSWEGD